VACGHIHEPQSIGDRIHYAGSAFPQNWGETHQAGVNIVDISVSEDPGEFLGLDVIDINFAVNIKRVDLPFPQRVKLSLGPQQEFNRSEVTGLLTWIEITGTQEELASINTDAVLRDAMDFGALEGSRVTLNILPTETVRAEEIAEAQRLRDKVKVWAESSGEKVVESILDKADYLEGELSCSVGAAFDGAHIRIDRLDLRGSIGIWKGTGIDTVSIDFADYDPGLVALIGSNGKGKTTLIENMHPWPQMLTREGKLQDHFRLRDSYRDLYFTNERNGVQYRALMQIDGQNKSGSVDYYLYWKDDAHVWQPLPEINGRREPYIEEIEKLYGSLSLYLRSAFISQRSTKGNPDLSEATKGERKSLFRELAGLDYLQSYAEAAKEQVTIAEASVSTDTGRLETLEGILDGIPALEERVSSGEKAVSEVNENLSATEKALKEAEEEHNKTIKLAEENRETSRKIGEVEGELVNTEAEYYKSLVGEKKTLESAIAHKDEAARKIGEWEQLTKQKEELQKQYQEYLEREREMKADWYREKELVEAQRARFREAITDNTREMNDVKQDKTRLGSKIEQLKSELSNPVSENCPTCGQAWPDEKKRVWIEERGEKEKSLSALEDDYAAIVQEVGDYEKAIETDRKELEKITDPVEPSIDEWDNTALENVSGELEWIDIQQEREILSVAETAAVKLDHITRRAAELGRKKCELVAQRTELVKLLNVGANEQEKQARLVVEKLSEQLSMYREQKASWTAKLEELRTQLDEMKQKEGEAREIRARIEEKKKAASQWRYLQRACGPDGIQALELDALAPSIAQVANRLLDAAYDSRFRIEFRTTRIGGSGSRVKQMETFEVYIHDTEAGTEQELKTLSGGESVWIKKAIYDAFGIIRAQNTGTKFTTAFFDEADGALDPEARERYFRMLEAAHAESGRRHTIVITHSREIQEMIEQRIVMDELVEAREEVMVNG
jgi:exonuclease SbcC